MQKQFQRGVLLEEGVLQMCCAFLGAYPCTGVISTKSQSKFVEFTLLQYNWGSRASKKRSFPKAFRPQPFSRESFKLWILKIYVTSNIFLSLMMSFLVFLQCDCFRQVGFEWTALDKLVLNGESATYSSFKFTC